MSPTYDLRDLLAYTAWQRTVWQRWFEREGPAPLAVSTGPHGDGRFPTIGSLIRHIFSAELRYLERMAGLPLTETGSIPAGDPTALFQLGDRARAQLGELLETWPEPEWDVAREVLILTSTVRMTPRKIMLHVLTHEIRHWAQVATLLRLDGWAVDRLDLLFSPVLGEPMLL